MSWHDCINPLGLPAHAHDFNLDTPKAILHYANKICPSCWFYLEKRKHPITTGYGNPKAFKQAGPDTL